MIKILNKKQKGFTLSRNVDIKSGFTLIELLIVIAIITLLSLIVFVGVNPSRQLKGARDNQRKVHVNVIHGAIMDYAARNEGNFPECVMLSANEVQLCEDELVPYHLKEMPKDPIGDSCSYFVKKNLAGRLGVKAECSEVQESITVGQWE
jgi:prepilin-type N-terminal cleavage/methylation domain-containing protein